MLYFHWWAVKYLSSVVNPTAIAALLLMSLFLLNCCYQRIIKQTTNYFQTCSYSVRNLCVNKSNIDGVMPFNGRGSGNCVFSNALPVLHYREFITYIHTVLFILLFKLTNNFKSWEESERKLSTVCNGSLDTENSINHRNVKKQWGWWWWMTEVTVYITERAS